MLIVRENKKKQLGGDLYQNESDTKSLPDN